MNSLVIYYSLDWNTKRISEIIWKEIWADFEALETIKPLVKSDSFMKYIWWWRMVMMNEIPEIKPLKNEFEKYDLIIIWTPVWAWTYSPPIAAFFEKYHIKGKKVAIFCCHWWWPGKTFDKMKEKLRWNEIIWEINFNEPLKKDTEIQFEKAIVWIKGIIKYLT
ncbi:MAG: flavodoxin [uncultured bacterium (gcode 4)]|uniref:Flavodoxin n=1 Tax=uncultured bacterium (gcode 4) TaxID=1234023 RepID=K2FZU6_9BACT|nr:MAG: flavodoxin [uncultured bacterium (gcode 4)]